ncbi:hypothetical protein [Desulfobulbus alkaliphilus]|uniref:hypothetical protein n=1 Tax=Desulfobulbus alkaliphilus TaxID=869814 RepID=UPI001966783C|nr:hypothetical protein [Desulfobulbus alkaliphilus]MBM9536167.1 hypothetical protein [Desulfobulbus alkaliphilus]
MQDDNRDHLPAEASTLPTPPTVSSPLPVGSVFSGPEMFDYGQRAARLLAASSLLPAAFKNSISDCFVVLEIAARIGASPLAVAQNIHIINGRPSWSAQFCISLVNSCGRFSQLKYDLTGEGDNRRCIAWAIEKATSERIEGPPVDINMAKAEGWFSKNGSKWKTMPELMLRYRAAAFFARTYLAEYLLGMGTIDEAHDIAASSQGNPAAAVEALLVDEADQ